MWDASEEPPGTMEGGPPEPMLHAREKCEQNKNQLESFKELMLKNKQSLKKKEEEVQEYARRLSKIKSRPKLSRRSKEGASTETTNLPKPEAILADAPEESIDDISQAKTPKAKSNLLQKKLAENRKAFEQRSKEITETKRAVEEKVEAIRQQLEEKEVAIMGLQKNQIPVTPVRPIVVTSDIMSPIQIGQLEEKDSKIAELSNKILELEATVLDLQENLKEKDSVIESKTKAVTLMSADLSKKGKTTLDTLEDTKDEMRTMQEHFVLLETSLKNKNENLLQQLHDRDNKILELEDTVKRFEQQVNEQKLVESASADFSRSTMDTLVETKDAMKSMQENFVLIESSLKAKNDNLLQQMQDYELKLAEANERIFQLESGAGIVKSPSVDDLQYKLDKLEQSNKQLQDEKYELQKSIAEMQDKIVNRSLHGNGALLEKDNRIAELENLIEELKQSNTLLEEESKAELQKQVAELSVKNEEYSNKVTDLEKLVHILEAEKNDMAAKLPDEHTATKEDDRVVKLTKELEELNKTMIKMKAQHRSKVKNLQKQLENFKMVSDTNAELVRLGNQVALLEEEKGNLLLSLVDFDELKASAGDWQERIADLETKVSAQTKEIQMNIEAIATLENQKLDLMQELHSAKQEISALEAENAESENLRVTAEMKVVDLEEQLESLHKSQKDSKAEESAPESHSTEKIISESGSTESFEAIQETDRTDLLRRIEDLTQRNNELMLKLTKLEEKSNSHAGSTESFETINDVDKQDLLKKIDQLTQENTDLTMKLNRVEEKGSSDTGSTESFERIPEQTESMTKIELLTQENSELVIKLTKLEEQLEHLESNRLDTSKSDTDVRLEIESLRQENNDHILQLENLRAQVTEFTEENSNLQRRIEALTAENNDLVIRHTKLEERILQSSNETADAHERSVRQTDAVDQIQVLIEEKSILEKELKELRNNLEQSSVLTKVTELEESNQNLLDSLKELTREKEELHVKINDLSNDFAQERSELISKLETVNQEKEDIAQQRQELQEKINTLSSKSKTELLETQADQSSIDETDSMLVTSLEREIENYRKLIAEQTDLIEEMKMKLESKEKELEEKTKLIIEHEDSERKAESLEQELKDMLNTMEEWKYKCNEMEEKMKILEAGKASIEDGLKTLQNENELLLEEKKEKEAMNNLLKQQLEENIASLESRLQEEVATVIARDNEISLLKDTIQSKDQELSAKYSQLQNEMIAIDNLQDELNTYKALLQERDSALMTVSDEAAKLNDIVRSKEEDMHALKKDLMESHDKLQKEYDELVEVLTNKDLHLHQMQSRLEENANEKSNLLVKVEGLSQQNDDLQNHLMKMEQEISELKTLQDHLEHQIVEHENKRTVAENQVSELEAQLDKNSKFVENLQEEISSSYKQMENLKEKYVEDTQKLNEKLEVLMQELNTRTQENEVLKNEIEEKQRLLGQNVTEEIKITLEARVTELEKELADANEKIQMQLEKMKKIAATLKKKTALCQELEGRVAELEEKWTTEKTEKEEKIKKIEEAENVIREADQRIMDLEEKLMQARKEVAESLLNAENVATELANSKEKMSSLIQQITEMEEEIVKLRAENDSCTAQLETEKREKEKLVVEFESYKETVIQENERTQTELEEFKEKARELSVRMQVMEAEYVEQLALIKNLKAENGLLLSKQTQINEKLENAEKKSEECKLIIEQLQSETTARETTTTGAATQTEEETTEDDTRTSAVQHFDHCEQCQTLVQALEAKLQEREAEIENLDNELANSIGNFVQMRESLRFNDLMNQTSMRNRSLEDPYNELLFQYNTLTTNHEEVNVKLNDVLKENKDLKEKIESLESINATMNERIVGMERELAQDREQIENVQSDDSVNADLVKKCEERETELLNMQKEVETIREHAEKLEEQLNSQTSQFSSEKEQLMEKEKLLAGMKESLEQEIESLKNEKLSCEKRMDDLEKELEMHKQQSIVCKDESMMLNEAPVIDRASDVQDDAPQLFDASKIFGTTFGSDSSVSNDKEVARLEKLLGEKEVQCSNLTAEIDHLQKQMTEERSRVSQDYITCSQKLKMTLEYLDTARADVEHLKHDLAEKDKQIESLNLELSSIQSHALVHLQQQNDTDKPDPLMSSQDNHVEELMAELNSTKEMLEALTVERDRQNQVIESYKLQIANFEAELRNSTDADLIQDLEQRILVTLKEKDLLQLQVNDLSRALEEVKEAAEKQRNLHIDIDNAMRERDEAKELVANLTQALEDSHKRLAEIEVQKRAVQEAVEEEVLLKEPDVSKESYQEQQASKSSTDNVEPAVHLDVGSAWDAGSTEKLNVDEETWGWNAEDVQGTDDQQISAKLIPSTEMQLRVKIDDLQDQIKDLEAEKEKIVEGNKAAQVRSGKMVKKLKEYKVQIENLQQQLKMQKSASDFYELDSAIEEELKSQISKLEKSLNELKEEHKNTVAEKESIMKRLDVVVSANERYMEMKERQDMDMEVLRIQNKELTQKIQALDARLQENVTSVEKSEPPSSEDHEQRPSENVESSEHQPRKRSVDDQTDFDGLSKKYKDEIDDLKDEMEALAAENEQLQHFLEEQKTKLSSLEIKRNEEESEYMQVIDELNRKVSELQGILNKSKEEYDLLRKQYEQSLMDANDQVSVMRQNTDLLKTEAFEKNSKLETEITNLRQQTEVSELKISQLEKSLQDALQEKISLEEKVVTLMDTEEKLSSVNASLTEVTDLLNVRIQEVADLKQELQRQYIDREQAENKLQNDIDSLSQELNAKKQELEDLRQSFSHKEQELIQQQSVETVSAIVSQATQELAQKHAIEVEEKDMEIRDLIKKIATLEATIDGCSLEIQNNVATFTSLQQELEFLKQNLAEKDLILESVQSNLNTTKEEIIIKQSKLTSCEEELNALTLEKQKYLGEISDLQTRLSESEAASSNLYEYTVRMENLQRELEVTKTALSEKELLLQQYVKQSEEYQAHLEICKSEINQLRTGLQEIDILRNELREKTDQVNYLNSELETTQKALEETRKTLSEKISSLESTNRLLNEKQSELEKFSATSSVQQQSGVVNIIDDLPVFHMADNNTQDLQNAIHALKEQLEKKDEEIEHLKYILSENTYPSIIQEMQDQINVIYNQKNELETALSIATQTLAEKEKQLIDMKQHIQVQSQEVVSKEDMNLLTRERRSTHDQEEIVRLQNEVHAKEQEINDLKYIIAEKDSQLSLQASMESPSDDFELRETVQRLTAEVYGKEQEIKHLKSTITELQKEISDLQEFERISKESKDTIQKLTLEKEHVRLEGEEILEKKLREKEAEIDEIKQRLAIENQKILDELHLRDKDIENLKKQLEQSSAVEHETTDKLHQKEVELMRVNTDLAEKERRLAELSITKDAELHNLKVQIHEKDVRIEELLALSEEEEKQLVELRNSLDARETEVNTLKRLLEDKVKEYELIQHALKKDIPMMDAPASPPVEGTTGGESKESTSQELDLALYMLHQRDVRCEELTHELMQLLEERDTLQLRLSNAIRVNEELRRMGSSDSSSKKEASSPESEEPLVEHPSPSKSEGPVEIAKEAIDSPIGEDKEALALKLSQLHTVSHTKDVRLKDERELRHAQQMSLLAHKDVLSTLPPEAAARLVNANYTLSRDVQSQSSVLLNWLWGKREYGNVTHV